MFASAVVDEGGDISEEDDCVEDGSDNDDLVMANPNRRQRYQSDSDSDSDAASPSINESM